MKPSPGGGSARWSSHYDRCDGCNSAFPPIDLEFQPRRFGGFGGDGLPWRRPGFSGLAGKVLLAGASRGFRIEMAIFGIVALVCAWPIVMMIRELLYLLP
jgi:hypothetical protein